MLFLFYSFLEPEIQFCISDILNGLFYELRDVATKTELLIAGTRMISSAISRISKTRLCRLNHIDMQICNKTVKLIVLISAWVRKQNHRNVKGEQKNLNTTINQS